MGLFPLFVSTRRFRHEGPVDQGVLGVSTTVWASRNPQFTDEIVGQFSDGRTLVVTKLGRLSRYKLACHY
jgi:hypothetical protein